MILTKFIEVGWSVQNREWYESLGYKWTKKGNKFKVKPKDIKNKEISNDKIDAKCDYCGIEFPTTISQYYNNLYENNKYKCKDCIDKELYSKYEGKKYNRLIIKKYLGHYKTTQKAKQHWFLCDCDCGNKDVIKTYAYLHSDVEIKSCGCWNLENIIRFNYETKTSFDNKYYINEDNSYTIICIRLKKEYKVIVDEPFFIFLKQLNRKLQIDSRGYAYITRIDSTRQLFIHNLIIFGFDYYDKNMKINVDHINNKEIRDDRKSNLRPADDYENTQNAKRRKDNTRGIKGFCIRITDRPTAYINVGIQAHKNRIRKDFILCPEGLKEAIIWNHNKRLELHSDFANFGYDIKNKSLEEIIKEQTEIFISNLTEEQEKVFYNNGYTYTPIKNKPRQITYNN